jgi:hypothetical protein
VSSDRDAIKGAKAAWQCDNCWLFWRRKRLRETWMTARVRSWNSIGDSQISNRRTGEWKIRPSEELLPAERDRKWKRECRRGADDDVPRQPERQVKIFAFLFSSNGDSVACSRSQAQPETRKAHSSEINSQLKNTLLFLISRRSSGRPTSDELSMPAKQAYDHALTLTIIT